jgi:ABC-2 type transport system permease protein
VDFRVLTRVVRHEWRLLFSDRTPWFVLLLLAVSIGYGVLNGVQWVRFQETTLQNARNEQARRYSDVKKQLADIMGGRRVEGFADPRSPDVAGSRVGWQYAAMSPLQLSALSIGQSDVLPYYFKVTTGSKESVLTSNEIENPHRLLQGRFDLSFVVIYLFPLLIIAFGYSVISWEQEGGTLALLLSQPVALRTFMAAKIGLRAVLIIAVVVLFSIVGLALGGVRISSTDTLIRFIVWTGIVAAYALFWFGVVLFVASFGRGSAANAMALSAVWLALVVVLPSTLNMAASVLYPMPSRVDMIAALRVASEEASAKGDRLLARYYGDHPDLAAVSDVEKAANDVAITRLAIDDEIESRVRPVVDKYDVQLANQQKLVDRFRLFSPAIVAQEALNDIAGTGAARYRHFVSMAESYHAQWRSIFAPMIARKQKLTPAMYDSLPAFEFREEPLSTVMLRTSFAILCLFGSGIVMGSAGIYRLRTFPISG